MQRTRTVLTSLLTLVVLGTTVACGDDKGDDKGAGPQETVVIDITVKGDTVEPSGDRVDARPGQPIDLVVDADRSGTLHVHSDPEQAFEFEAGTTTFPIAIDKPGVVSVETHDPDQIVVQLEIR